jgi:hypothetical protein
LHVYSFFGIIIPNLALKYRKIFFCKEKYLKSLSRVSHVAADDLKLRQLASLSQMRGAKDEAV